MTATVADFLRVAPLAEMPVSEGRDPAEVRALLEAARAGSREAFGELVTRHERSVFRVTLTALGNRDDALDAAQDAFVLAWRKLSGFRGEAAFRTWLLTIAWRKALDHRRARQIGWRRSAAMPEEVDPVDALASVGADPERTALARDLARRARTQIARLSPKLRDALLLAASGEYSYGEIAAMLRVPLGTVKWRVSEARRIIGNRMSTWTE
ncbi:MAG TPA: RNA polymerase sigma factor [Vicinamibacterales bacterium]|nr:RNA polymerase sigma factor [Vicinamibacterales bacterium]